MGCSVFAQRYGLQRVRHTLTVLPRAGFGPLTEPYQAVIKLRNELLGNLGLKVPKPTYLLKALAALSPGSVKLWLDAESGWMTEAREKPGAPPVYHYVKDAVALEILGGKLTHELEAELMTPDDYLGE